MKHLIILPAESELDSAWATRLESRFGGAFDTIYTQAYSHWTDGDEATFDLLIEEEKLRNHLATIPADATVVVFAKYAGAILALLAGQSGVLKANHCFFFGPAFDWANRYVFSGNFSVVEGYKLPTTVFHSQYDMVSAYIISKKTIDEHASTIKFVTTPGYEFTYDDYPSYIEHIAPVFLALQLSLAKMQ